MKKRLFSVLCGALACLALFASCGKKGNKGEGTRETIEMDPDDTYDYGKLDCDNGNFTFLQCEEDYWGMKTALAPADANGEEVTDEVYSRNKKIETLYNVNIKCINVNIYDTPEYMRAQGMGGDVTVDAGFVLGSGVATLLGENLLNDFSANQNLQIYEPWWGQKIREESQFGSAICFAQSDISLTAFELTWCVAINLDMVANLGMEHPYTLVKDGEWTMAKLFEMASDGMSPNPDGTYEYREDTSCVMGFVTYNNFAMAGINGAGCFLTKKDEAGLPAFSGEGQKFIDVVEQWAKAFHTAGLADEAQEDGYHYETVFAKKRAFAAGVEIKATSIFREAGLHYGIVPVPMYDTEQKTYYSNVNYLAPLLVIPKTNSDTEKTGIILDAMAYLSYKDLLPVYYNSNLAYKALGTPEAVEMLNIIRDSRCFETSLLYGWTTDYYMEVRNVFIGVTPGTSPSGAIGKYAGTVRQTISNFIANLK